MPHIQLDCQESSISHSIRIASIFGNSNRCFTYFQNSTPVYTWLSKENDMKKLFLIIVASSRYYVGVHINQSRCVVQKRC